MKLLDWINIALSLVLTAAGMMFQSHGNAIGSLMLIIATGVILGLCISKYIEQIPRLIINRASAIQLVEKVYGKLASTGGLAYATHVQAFSAQPETDKAVDALRKATKKVDFQRLVFIEDKELEKTWIDNTLSIKNENVQVTVHSVQPTVLLPRFLWKVLPRINVLLCQCNESYHSILGFDIRTNGEANDSFTIYFRSKTAFNILSARFHNWTSHKSLETDKDLQEFQSDRRTALIAPRVQKSILALVSAAEENSEILHIGIFGSRAQCFCGLTRPDDGEKADSDLDIIVIYEGDRNQAKRAIETALKPLGNNHIAWGDDDNNFYNYRDEKLLTIDVELHEKDSSFFSDNTLLGFSFFNPYYCVYYKDASCVVSTLLKLPDTFHRRVFRLKVLIEDRKGISDFIEKTARHSQDTDPRRLISQLVRNGAWAISGSRPVSVRSAYNLISKDWPAVGEHIKKKKLLETVKGETSRISRDQAKLISDVIELAKIIKQHAEIDIAAAESNNNSTSPIPFNAPTRNIQQ